MTIPDVLIPRRDLYNNEPLGPRHYEPLQGQAAVDSAYAAAEQRARYAQSPLAALIDQMANEMLGGTRIDWDKMPRDVMVKRPGQMVAMMAAASRDEQTARARARYQLGLPVGPELERQFRYEGVEGEGRLRLDSYADNAPRQLGKQARKQGDLDVAAYVVGRRMGLSEGDYEVVGKLLQLKDQDLATCLAAVHPERLRQMFADGIPTHAGYINELPALIKQWAAIDGSYG